MEGLVGGKGCGAEEGGPGSLHRMEMFSSHKESPGTKRKLQEPCGGDSPGPQVIPCWGLMRSGLREKVVLSVQLPAQHSEDDFVPLPSPWPPCG